MNIAFSNFSDTILTFYRDYRIPYRNDTFFIFLFFIFGVTVARYRTIGSRVSQRHRHNTRRATHWTLPHIHTESGRRRLLPQCRAGKSGWGGSDRIAGAGRWLPVSTYYLTSIVLD